MRSLRDCIYFKDVSQVFVLSFFLCCLFVCWGVGVFVCLFVFLFVCYLLVCLFVCWVLGCLFDCFFLGGVLYFGGVF